jgi:cell division protein FtsZ
MNLETSGTPFIKILGIGGAGCNAINKLFPIQKSNWELYALNTDQKSLDRNKATNKIHLGIGMKGAGGNQEDGKWAAIQSIDKLDKVLKDSKIVILAAGLGGGTGSGATPVIAKLAREAGARVFIIVTMPFEHEGPLRKERAQSALKELRGVSGSIKVIENDSMSSLEFSPGEDAFLAGFNHIDTVIAGEIIRIESELTSEAI